MIDGVGKGVPGRIDPARAEKGGPAAAAASTGSRAAQGGVESAVFDLVSGRAPVDGARVAAIRSAIAEGRYPINPDAIAERMLAIDLPQR